MDALRSTILFGNLTVLPSFGRFSFSTLSALLFFWSIASGAAMAAWDAALVSTDSGGVAANGNSAISSINTNGRYIVFVSYASNLVPDDTNGMSDVFVKDLLTGMTTRVSTSIDDQGANGPSDEPDISDDGRYVVFTSYANNLVAGDMNKRSDVFLKDMVTGELTLLSTGVTGAQGSRGSRRPAITPDGSHIVFTSRDNLYGGKPSKRGYIYVKNRLSGEIKVVNTDSEGHFVSGTLPSISPDGRYIAFMDEQVYLKDTVTGELTVVSTDQEGNEGFSADLSTKPDLSADGRYVVFASDASNLVPNDTNRGSDDEGIVEFTDVFLKDTHTGSIKRVNTDRQGREVYGWAGHVSISEDGRFVVFDTIANDLVASDHDGGFDVYMRDMLTGAVVLLSPGKTESYRGSSRAVISGDGHYITFASYASDLVAGDDNGNQDIFRVSSPLYTADGDFDGDGLSDADEVALGTDFQQADSDGDGLSDGDEIGGDGFYDPGVDTDPLKADSDGDGDGDGAERGFGSDPLDAGSRLAGVLRMSTASDGGEARAASQDGSVSADGRYTVFTSAASNWVAGDGNGVSDIFLKDGLSAALTRVSLGSQAEEGNGASGEAMLSADGRYVVFSSAASNWVADGNGVTDIYLKDLSSGALSRVSTDSNGGEANAASSRPVISADGQYVAFVSAADNLVAGDGNGVADVFVKNTRTGQLSRVSADSEGRGGNGRSDGAVISADGRYVVFRSAADDLVEQDLNGVDDVFRKDLATGTLVRISEDQSGVDGNSASRDAAMSGDGRYVVFRSAADNWSGGDTNGVEDIFWKDTHTGELRPLSPGTANGRSFNPTLSVDGRYAVFMSAATNLVTGDSNGETDVFVKELQSGSVTRLNLDDLGGEANGRSYQAMVSGDGRWVVFDSVADNLVDDDGNRRRDVFKAVNSLFAADGDGDGLSDAVEAVLGTDAAQTDSDGDGLSDGEEAGVDGRYDAGGDTDPLNADTDGDGAVDGTERHFGGDPLTAAVTVDHVRLSTSSAGEEGHGASRDGAINFDGRYIVFASKADDLVADDTNGVRDIFLKDSLSGELVRLSTAADGTEGNGGSFDPVISADGRYVAFESEATNLVAGDTNGVSDIFVKDMATGAVVRGNLDRAGTQAQSGGSYNPVISADGRYVIFSSAAENFLWDSDYDYYVGRPESFREVYHKDLISGQLTRLSPLSKGRDGNLWSDHAAISSDGQAVVFHSNASQLVENDVKQVFLRTITAAKGVNRPALVSSDRLGVQASESSQEADISADGRFVVFTSASPDLLTGDSNGFSDIFLKELATGAISRISLGVAGEQGNADSKDAAISANGRYVAFASYADNWVAGDDNGRSDIFVKDVLSGQLQLVSASPSGVPGNRDSLRPAISGDGRYIVFDSGVNDIVAGDGNGRKDVFRVLNPLFVQDFDGDGLTDEAEVLLGSDPHNIDSDGDFLTDGEEVGLDGVYDSTTETDPLKTDSDGDGVDDGLEVEAGSDPLDPVSTALPRTLRASVGRDGQEANQASFAANISADGRYVVFFTEADNLVEDDSNEVGDIFLKDLKTGLLTRVNTNVYGHQINGTSSEFTISSDGRFVVFASRATNLVDDDSTENLDVFRKDVLTGEVIHVSTNGSGSPAGADSSDPVISSSGRYVVFSSHSDNIVPGDNNHRADIFWKDLLTGQVKAVSMSSSGIWANDASYLPKLSADGRYVIFVSGADNLVAGDTNDGRDIFLKDTVTGALTRVNTDSQGIQLKGTGCCSYPFISADGRYVVFNLSEGIFLKDLLNGVLTQEIENNDQLYNTDFPSISADGRYVAFAAGDDRYKGDIYVKDRLTGHVSTVRTEGFGNRISRWPRISVDGRFVAYTSDASNLVRSDRNNVGDVFRTTNPLFSQGKIDEDTDGDGVFDMAEVALGTDPHNPDSDDDGLTDGEEIDFDGHYQAGVDTDPLNPDSDGDSEVDGLELTFGSDPLNVQSMPHETLRISVDSSGNQGNDWSDFPQVSADGRYIVFRSWATDFVSADTNATSDVYLKDMYTGLLTRVSTASGGGEGNGFDWYSTISADGRYVVFSSESDNLTAGDTNNHSDVFMKNLVTDETRRVSTDSLDRQANGYSRYVDVSEEGRYVVFESSARNLVPDDTNGRRDIFLKDTESGELVRLSTGAGGEQSDGHSNAPVVSDDGRYVFFYSGATNLVPGDQNGRRDVFKRDRLTGEIELISAGNEGEQGNGHSRNPQISADGRYVVFDSEANNLVPGDRNSKIDIFLKDTLTGQLTRVSTDETGREADDHNQNAKISRDGRYVVFTSRLKNFLTGSDIPFLPHTVFVKDIANGALSPVVPERFSAPTVASINDHASFSLDGRYIVFSSSADDLVSGDGNQEKDVFRVKNPLYQADSDSDGLADSVETALGTDPHKADTDGDGRVDGEEVGADGRYDADVDTDPFVRDQTR